MLGNLVALLMPQSETVHCLRYLAGRGLALGEIPTVSALGDRRLVREAQSSPLRIIIFHVAGNRLPDEPVSSVTDSILY